MADKGYVNSNVAAGNVGQAFAVQGKAVKTMRQSFEVAAADNDGDFYRVFADVNPELIIKDIRVFNDAITGGTDFDLGLYDTVFNGGAVLEKDLLADGLDLSSANAADSPASGIGAVDIANLGKALHALLTSAQSIGSLKGGYDIVLTANTVGTAAGTIVVEIDYVDSL